MHASCANHRAPSCASPAEAVRLMGEALRGLSSEGESERVALSCARGRVLSESVRADRDSPAIDVSAMDGFAVRFADIEAMSGQLALDVHHEAAIGAPPRTLKAGTAMRIVTGAPVPVGADTVIRYEDVIEDAGAVRLAIAPGRVERGASIRRQGENAAAGSEVMRSGLLINAAMIGALASFGIDRVPVVRRVRVAIITTGDELVPPGAPVHPWQLRDSNGPVLRAMLEARPWIETAPATHVADDPDAIETAVRDAVRSADAVLMTGGVSMGHRDFVPRAVAAIGARTVFHTVAQRPGKPMFAAVFERGEGTARTDAAVPILGLPGNPLSVMVTARRLALPIVATLAGISQASLSAPARRVGDPDSATIALWWHRLVQECDGGEVALIAGRGSGDLAAAAASSGFIEVPPGGAIGAMMPYYAWDEV
ncbi:MAG: molybdopterin molybdotransferase MoeA [Phycisphaerae bacterium]|nr:molybdopterin molybdotransferase MoeA [Phycisphaerae bacterium]